MKSLIRAAALAASLVVLPTFAPAQDMPGMDHGAHKGGAAANPSTQAFEKAGERMHKDMGAGLTGDTDVDFANGMIPHHQGAIDMAKIELEYGKDPELRTLAQEIVKAQEGEIALLKAWLAKKGK